MIISVRVPEKIQIKEDFLKEVEKELDIRIYLKGDALELESDESYKLLKAKDVFKALFIGFDENECKKLIKDNYSLEIVRIKSFVRNLDNRDRLKELRGRIIGRKGKVKRNIEMLTGSRIIIHRNLVGIIGSEENVVLARRAIEMLLEGRMHSTVYSFLMKELQKRKKII